MRNAEWLANVVGLELLEAAQSVNIKKAHNETEDSLRARVIARWKGEPIPDPVVETKKPKRWWLTFIWTWQADLITLFIVLVMRVLWGRALHWRDGVWTELRYNSWPARTWYRNWGGTTFCHGGFFSYEQQRVLPHELHHVEQVEARMLAGFVIGIISFVSALVMGCSATGALVLLEVPWFGSWLLNYFAAMVQAYLRGEDPYRGNHLEEAAYALEDPRLK